MLTTIITVATAVLGSSVLSAFITAYFMNKKSIRDSQDSRHALVVTTQSTEKTVELTTASQMAIELTRLELQKTDLSIKTRNVLEEEWMKSHVRIGKLESEYERERDERILAENERLKQERKCEQEIYTLNQKLDIVLAKVGACPLKGHAECPCPLNLTIE